MMLRMLFLMTQRRTLRRSDETGQRLLESRKEGKLTHFIVRKVR
jgi:hypothetical protein